MPADPVRAVQPHPRGLRYFEESPFDKAKVDGGEKSRALQLYEQLAPGGFASIPDELCDADVESLERQLALRLDIEREERRMHFGAFALVCLLFFLVFTPMVLAGFASVPLALLLLLLLALLVPYVFVYFGYENRVRAMSLGRLRLLEARLRRQGAPGPGNAPRP